MSQIGEGERKERESTEPSRKLKITINRQNVLREGREGCMWR
jgi:hypothetical protein